MRSKRLQTITAILVITACCTMVLAFLVYHVTAKSLTREITNAYHVSLLHTRDRMETYLRQLDQATLQFEKTPEMNRFINQENNNDNELLDEIAMIMMMQRIHVSLEYVDNVVVYDVRTRTVHATNTTMNRTYSNYLPVVSAFSGMNEKRAFMNMTVNEIPTTLYIRKMPAFHQLQPVYILYHINQHIYDDFLGEDRYSDVGSYFILGRNGELIASRGTADPDAMNLWIERINHDKLQMSETSIGSFTLNSSFVTYLPMSYDGWIYAYAIPSHEYLHQLSTLRNVILLVSISLFVGSIVLSIVSSHWLWRGWNRVRTILDDHSPEPTRKSLNEFDILVSKIETIVEQKNTLKHQMNEMLPTVKDTFMLYLLDNGVRTVEDWNKINQYGVPLSSGSYGCFCVGIDMDWEEGKYDESDMMTFEYAVISVIREVLGQFGNGFAVRLDNGQFAAIVSSEDKEPEALAMTLDQIVRTIHRFIESYFPIRVSIGVSSIRTNFSHLNISCREAKELLCNKLIYGGNRIFTCEPVRENATFEAFPFREMENDILYGIRTRDRDYAYQSVAQLYQLITLPNIQYKWIQGKLVETAQSIFRQARRSLDVEATHEPTLDDLLQLRTLDDWVSWFRSRCIDPLIEQLNIRHKAQSENAVRQIVSYIREHLETDIKLEHCCKTLQIPVSFAKQALKESMNITFMELVLQERIERAKKWLLTDNMSVEEIARRLQYSNAQNFSRTFKKAVGIPPGQYRVGVEYNIVNQSEGLSE